MVMVGAFNVIGRVAVHDVSCMLTRHEEGIPPWAYRLVVCIEENRLNRVAT